MSQPGSTVPARGGASVPATECVNSNVGEVDPPKAVSPGIVNRPNPYQAVPSRGDTGMGAVRHFYFLGKEA